MVTPQGPPGEDPADEQSDEQSDDLERFDRFDTVAPPGDGLDDGLGEALDDDLGDGLGDGLDDGLEAGLEAGLDADLEAVSGADEEEEPGGPAVAPPVVAVVVTSDGGPGLEETLASLRDQDYPALSVLVLDNASSEDPTPRIAEVHPRAYVRRVPRNEGFAAAANHALRSVEGATFLLLCHDDVSLEPTTVRVLVEEAYRSNAAVVGPKLVEHDRREVLLEVGMAVDHYGVPFNPVEPGELDQEQHDAVRDVFYVSHAVMLVRADLFDELSGFDVRTHPGFDDVDLCWRARLAGGRILVAPDARVGHRRAALRRDGTGPEAGEVTRNRLRLLFKCYSALTLVWVAPAALLLDLLEAIALAVSGRVRRAGAVLAAWPATLRSLPELRRARRAAQALRRVPDRDIRDLMVRGSARVRTFLAVRLHAGDRLQDVSARTRSAMGEAGSRLRRVEVAGWLVLLAVLLVGSRELLAGRVPAVGSIAAWPGLGGLWDAFTATWRFAGTGSSAPAPAGLGLLSALSALFLGDTDLARTAVVAGALPLGAFGAFRLARPLASSGGPAMAAALAYAANPVARNALADGRFGALAFYALAPFTTAALLRASAPAGEGGRRRRALVELCALGAVSAALWPPALAYAPLAASAFLLASPLVGGWRLALRGVAASLAGAAGAAVLLLPWPLGLLEGDPSALGLLSRRPVGFTDLLHFETGPAGAGWAPWGLFIAAALPLLVATGPRLAWAGRAWLLAAASLGLAWLPGRLDPSLALPAAEGVLVPAAVGLSLAVGLGVAAFVEDLRRFLFGWRQVAAIATAFGLALPALGLLGDTVSGRWRMPARDWPQYLAWMADERADGGFRVLWLGDPDVLPLDARATGEVGYGLTRDGAGDVRDLWPAPRGDADDVLEAAIDLVAGEGTSRFGHLLAPLGVQYVALVDRRGPDASRRVEAPPRLVSALGAQLDLSVVQQDSGLVLYENLAWAPTRALLTGDAAAELPLEPGDPLAAAMRTSFFGSEAVTGRLGGFDVPAAGTLLFAEGADAGWRAEAGGEVLERVEPFGWTNAFEVREPGEVALRYEGGGARPLLVTAQMLVWSAMLAWLWRGRRSRAGGRPAGSDGEFPDLAEAVPTEGGR